jgi:uncharacterized phage protein (TIGR02218 family)
VRAVPAALALALESGAARLARCWQLLRADGMEVCATEHDRPLTIDGRTYQPGAALTPGELDQGGGSPARTSLDGAVGIGIDAITADDLTLGRWDHARVWLLVADWGAPSVWMPVWGGRIGRITQRGAAFELELEGLDAALEASIGRVFARQCDAALGDARCGAVLSAPQHRQVTTLGTVEGDRSLVIAAPGLPSAHLTGGTLEITSGRLAGTSWPIAAAELVGAGQRLVLGASLPLAPLAGDAVRVTVGCDHSFATCRDRFANAARFRGCPLMPGDDAVFAGPAASGNDGGRR